MPPKKPTKNGTEAALSAQEIEHSNTRSGYGDNHAATEDAMLSAHAKQLREAKVIDDKMAAELSKPRRNVPEVNVKYTQEYLAQHPDYTGKNAHEMPSYEVAARRQKAKDDAMLKMIEDFKAGRIDMHGRPIGRHAATAASDEEGISSGGSESKPGKRDGKADETSKKRMRIDAVMHPLQQLDGHSGDTTVTASDLSEPSPKKARLSRQTGHSGDTTVTASESSGPSPKKARINRTTGRSGNTTVTASDASDYSPRKARPSREIVHIKPGKKPLQLVVQLKSTQTPNTTPAPTPALPKLAIKPATQPSTPITTSASASAPASSTTSPSSSQGSTSQSSSTASKKRKRATREVEPLTPLPGKPSYAELNYFELTALCRERHIRSAGCADEVRNALVQDDWNIEEGRPRNLTKSSTKKRAYRTTAKDVSLKDGKCAVG